MQRLFTSVVSFTLLALVVVNAEAQPVPGFNDGGGTSGHGHDHGPIRPGFNDPPDVHGRNPTGVATHSARFINRRSDTITLTVGSETVTVRPDHYVTLTTYVGQTYQVAGQPHSTGQGTMVGGGVFVATVASRGDVTIGGTAVVPADIPRDLPIDGPIGTDPPRETRTFSARFINRGSEKVTLVLGSTRVTIRPDYFVTLTTYRGQRYQLIGEPRLVPGGGMLGGATMVGTVNQSSGDVILGGSGSVPADRPTGGGGTGIPAASGLFTVSFRNNRSGTITLTLMDRSSRVISTREVRSRESIVATMGEQYSYRYNGSEFANGTTVFFSGEGTVASSKRSVDLN